MAGGGTGGHIYPAIAIAEKIMRKQPDSEILFIGANKGMEKELLRNRGYKVRFIDIRGFSRTKPLKNIGALCKLIRAGGEIKGILREFKPDVVIGTGGYVSGPVVREAGKAGIRAFVHEQNAFPGMANKMAEKYAEKVFLAFGEAAPFFKSPEKTLVVGNPLRTEFITANAVGYREKLGIGNGEFVLLCFGGSLGARAINENFSAVLADLHRESDMRVYFVTGKAHYAKALLTLQDAGIPMGDRVVVMEYTDQMHAYMAAADLIISRSGALTVSEITACGKASILIPSPNVTGNHQFFNAKTVADRGGALLLTEDALSPAKLLDAVLRLKGNKSLLNTMGAASERLGRLDAADVIYDCVSEKGSHGK